MHRRDSERGSFRNNPELTIVFVVTGIVAAIAIPIFLQYTSRKGRTCLENLAALTEKPGEKKSCPACDKPYAVSSTKETETVSCPAPADHLSSSPRFVRAAGGAWSLEQTLPPYTGEPIEIRTSAVEIQETPGRTSVFVKPSFFSRWVTGGFLVLFLGILALVFLGAALQALIKKDRATLWGGLFAMTIPSVLLYFVAGSYFSSHEFVFETGSGRATRIDYVWGSRRTETLYKGCLGVVPTGTAMLRLDLVHAPDAEGRRVTTLGDVSANRLDLARWFNRALLGR